jgi:hypothetical protein
MQNNRTLQIKAAIPNIIRPIFTALFISILPQLLPFLRRGADGADRDGQQTGFRHWFQF